MKLNILKLWYSFIIVFFIACERIAAFQRLDQLHIKHYLLIITILLSLIVLNGKRLKQIKEFAPIFYSTGALYIISLFFQLKQGKFKIYSLQEVYYFIIPLIFVIILYNSTSKNYLDDYIKLMFNTSVICLIIIFVTADNFSLSNFIAIFNLKSLFIDSESAVVETDLSVFFAMFYIYFSYKKDKIRKTLAAICCFIGYKRFAVLFVFMGIILFKFVKKHSKTPKYLLYLTVIAFIIAPFVVYYICDDTFVSWFYKKTGLDFNQFTMSRLEIINAVIDAHLINYGLGTISHFLERRARSGQLNMHNDILRIYMETTIVGTIIFTTSYFRITRDNIYKYFLMLFIFIELFVAHFLASGTIAFWFLAFLILMSINTQEANYKQQLIKDAEAQKNI